ncbi:hydrolase 1, exosortase A system-associated [uncultured Sphingosinicella sp.]|uniref:hydrolase 1, exosortase A system-associated n=1 Tax=uncultured Sphingosinicella sp. TaxID=478748 RepID=UPI0030D7CA6B|tara:strand:+ start:90938 stop:91705 length:768 start_codon:yes stop_codon:yes gene_type:complete
MIRPLAISCGGTPLAATLHPGEAPRAALIVSGGVQTRVGPHRLFTQLAEALGGQGMAALRFDRRGVGDSEGENTGFLGSAVDIAAAASVLRSEGGTDIVGIGLCDGAAALALFGAASGIQRLVLLNPWSFDSDVAEMPAAAQRDRTLKRLLDPRNWLRILSGGIDVKGALKTLFSRGGVAESALSARLIAAINAFPGPVLVPLSRGDATAEAFAALLPALGPHVHPVWLENADHTLTRPEARQALFTAITDWLAK